MGGVAQGPSRRRGDQPGSFGGLCPGGDRRRLPGPAGRRPLALAEEPARGRRGRARATLGGRRRGPQDHGNPHGAGPGSGGPRDPRGTSPRGGGPRDPRGTSPRGGGPRSRRGDIARRIVPSSTVGRTASRIAAPPGRAVEAPGANRPVRARPRAPPAGPLGRPDRPRTGPVAAVRVPLPAT